METMSEIITAATSTPQRWETRVIHLNIANTPTTQPQQAPQQPNEQAGNPKPPFSENYLKQEFPDHYSPQQPTGSDPSQHPAIQLQGFINGLGQEGWEFIGVFPVGQLVMMFFRRPLPAQPAADEPAPATTQPQDLLQQILQRLDALEGGATRASHVTHSERISTETNQNKPRILTASQLQQLPQEPSLPTQHAVKALGLRSASGLLNYGSRHGFRPGLVKLVNNGMVAVYIGSEKPLRGGRAIRLWKVLHQSGLPPQ
jgi:hypothetical protein